MIGANPSLTDSTHGIEEADRPNTADRLTWTIFVELQRALRAGAIAERDHHDPEPTRALYQDDRGPEG